MQNLRSYVEQEGDGADEDAHDVDDVVAVAKDLTSTTSVDTPLLVGLDRAREGLGDEGTLRVGCCVGDGGGGVAGGAGELIDKTEDKVPWQCAAKVRDATYKQSVRLRMRRNMLGELTWLAGSCRCRR